MDELSIATAVLEVVTRHARGQRVTRVDLRIGHVRGVAPAALRSAFQDVASDTPARGAVVAIEDVRGDELVVASIELDDRELTGGWRCSVPR
jgi:hydrogenase nickel incorporation protein HypA/HybF